jgi:hypothetical protein
MPWKASSDMEERLRFVARLPGRGGHDGRMPGIRCIAQDRLQDFRSLQGARPAGLDRSLEAAGALCQLPEQVEGLIVRLEAEKPHWGARCRRRGCRTLIDAALPVSIVGLQDADKVRHAGPIPVIGRDWHLKIWCGLALPKPPHEIGNLLHGAHSERGA